MRNLNMYDWCTVDQPDSQKVEAQKLFKKAVYSIFSIIMIISNFSYNFASFGDRWIVEWL